MLTLKRRCMHWGSLFKYPSLLLRSPHTYLTSHFPIHLNLWTNVSTMTYPTHKWPPIGLSESFTRMSPYPLSNFSVTWLAFVRGISILPTTRWEWLESISSYKKERKLLHILFISPYCLLHVPPFGDWNEHQWCFDHRWSNRCLSFSHSSRTVTVWFVLLYKKKKKKLKKVNAHIKIKCTQAQCRAWYARVLVFISIFA